MKNNLMMKIFMTFAEFNGGVVDNKQSSSNNIPSNEVNTSIDLNNGGWVLILGLFLAVVVCIIVIAVLSNKVSVLKEEVKEKASQTNPIINSENDLTENEKQIVLTYRELSEKEKQLIDNTISTLADKSKNE